MNINIIKDSRLEQYLKNTKLLMFIISILVKK